VGSPNILLIMSDDHAANAISCYGSRLADAAPTPNIDRIAAEGARADNCFCTNSICTPSRATILTGQYSHVNGVYTLADAIDPQRPNVAKMMRAAGYQTAVFGKWHLKTEPSGFDQWCVLPGQGLYSNPEFIHPVEGEKPGTAGEAECGFGAARIHEGYVTDLITDMCLNWLAARDRNRPFLLMCHHKAPHDNWEYHGRHEHVFDGVEFPEPQSLFEDKSHRSPGSRTYGTTISPANKRRNMVKQVTSPDWPNGPIDVTGMDEVQQTRAAYRKYMLDYLRTVRGIDESVGRLLEYLDAERLADDTVVIYTSDQGQLLGEHDYFDKRWIFEESLRMPFLVRYPREIPPGSVNADILINPDFAPTFLDYAALATPEDMQGRSFRANLAGRTPGDWRGSMYYRYWMHMAHHDNPAHYGVRTLKHKLIFFYGLPLDAAGAVPEPTTPGWELYNLERDPNELHNVYDDPACADVVRELKAELDRLKEQLGDTDEKYPELAAVRGSLD